jgi:hypothetical protein
MLLALLACSGFGATFQIVNLDPAGYGFNDTTPVAALPTNPGTTLGDQRLHVLQSAMDVWGGYLHSDVVIKVEAEFQAFGGSPTGYVLAGASTITVHANFANAPVSGTYYPAALANSLAGSDLSSSNSDISVTANSSLDSDPALDDWYYGLDGNAPENTIDFHDVILHELGHGLGFASYVDETNGRFFNGIPDIFSINLYDTEQAEGWDTMRNNERKNSAVNDPDLVWIGDYTKAASEHMLETKPMIDVTAPPGIAGLYEYEAALYGPDVPVAPEETISGELVIVDDGVGTLTDACEPLAEGSLTGKIAYIDRGDCNFDAKSLNAQQAGAIAVVIANNVEGWPLYMDGNDAPDDTLLTIPTVAISMADGATLVGASPGVMLEIGVPGTVQAGTSAGYIRMYAPNPVEQGSSVSHWSTDASPDLLMEPFINPVLREDLDLSLTLLKDIGWTVIDIPFPHLTYDLWVLEAFSPGATLTGRTQDAEGDGVLNIEEYFFGGDPESASLERLPVMEYSDPDLDHVFTRSIAPADMSYSYEISTTVRGWVAAVEGVDYTEEIVSAIGTTAEEVRLKLIKPASGGKVFVRLRITEDAGP